MSQHTEISWCDSTVNPTSGCDGCELWVPGKGGPCYAAKLHETRLAKAHPSLYAASFSEVRLIPGRMAKAAAWSDLRGKDRPDKPWLNGRPRMIFLGDMGDIFSEAVPFEYLLDEAIFPVESEQGRRHVWLALTKRPKRMAKFADWLGRWPDNLWAGASVTTQETTARLGGLMSVPARCRFISVEPLLGPIDLRLKGIDDWNGPGVNVRVDWVIVGGESGPNPRPMNPDWARSIRDQCRSAGVPFFMKQMSGRAEIPADLMVRGVPVAERDQ